MKLFLETLFLCLTFRFLAKLKKSFAFAALVAMVPAKSAHFKAFP